MEKCEKFSFYWQRCSQSPSISLFHPQMGKVGHFLQKAAAPWWKGKECQFWQKCKTSGQVFPQLPMENWDTFYFSVCSFTWVDRWVVFPLRVHFGKSGKAPWSIFSLLLPLIICGLEKNPLFQPQMRKVRWDTFDKTFHCALYFAVIICTCTSSCAFKFVNLIWRWRIVSKDSTICQNL